MQQTRTVVRTTKGGTKLGSPSENPMVESWQIAEDACHALYGSMIVTIVQALQALQATSDEHGWNVVLGDCLSVWSSGSLVSSSLLEPLVAAIGRTSIDSIMEDPPLASELTRRQLGWRRIVTLGTASGVSNTTLSSSLGYYDALHNIPMYSAGQVYQFSTVL